jgi:hypothetical protein
MRMQAIPLVRRLRPWHAVAVLLPCIAAIGLLGADYGQDPSRIWDLGKEHNLPSAFSALLLCAAGGLAVLLAEADPRAGTRATLVGLFFLWMALDEYVALHERPEDVTGVAWPIFWLPVMVLGVMLGVRLLQALDRPAVVLLVAGAAAWACAPVLDVVQEGVAEPGSGLFEFILAAEELAELCGSVLFIAALLMALRAPRLDALAA